jgi:hypothetical protein
MVSKAFDADLTAAGIPEDAHLTLESWAMSAGQVLPKMGMSDREVIANLPNHVAPVRPLAHPVGPRRRRATDRVGQHDSRRPQDRRGPRARPGWLVVAHGTTTRIIHRQLLLRAEYLLLQGGIAEYLAFDDLAVLERPHVGLLAGLSAGGDLGEHDDDVAVREELLGRHG